MYTLDPKRYEKIESHLVGKLYFLYKTRRWYILADQWQEVKHTRNNAKIIADHLKLTVTDYLTGYNEFYDWLSLVKHDERFFMVDVLDFINKVGENNDQ